MKTIRHGIYLSYSNLCFVLLSTLAGAQQIAVTPSTLNFGTVSVGSSQTQPLSVRNVSSSKVGVSQASVAGAGYTISGIALPLVLSPGQTSSFKVTFAPSSNGVQTGSVSLVSQLWPRKRRASASATAVALSGSGTGSALLAASPASVAFGSVIVGSSQTFSVTLTNVATATADISQVAMSNAAFTVSGLILPATLTPGQSLTFNIVFAPPASGSTSGSLTISSDAANSPLSLALSGTGATPGQLQLSPATYNFGNVTTGTSAAMNGTLAAGGSSITISSASSNNSEFKLSGLSLPITLASGQSVPFSVTFSPQGSGTTVGSISFLSNGANNPTTESVSGTGVAPVQHSVALSWSESSTSGVVGYNVYRSSVSGGPYAALTSSPDPSLTFSDTTVSAGQTYYYVVTALNSSGIESLYSNEAQAIIPSP